jgi:hypothetical protein
MSGMNEGCVLMNMHCGDEFENRKPREGKKQLHAYLAMPTPYHSELLSLALLSAIEARPGASLTTRGDVGRAIDPPGVRDGNPEDRGEG